MSKVFSTTTPLPGDTFNALLAKLLQKLGGTPDFGDRDTVLLRKILERLTGVTVDPDLTGPVLVAAILLALEAA